MAIKYIPYFPDTVQGQAILDNVTRTRRVLRYKDNGKTLERLRRGLPLYETSEAETVGADDTPNLLLRGECLSACAYLKDQGITVDLVYIDPPFASGADYAKKVFLRRHPDKAAQIAQAGAELELDELRAFEEKMYGDIWNKEDYLNWMFENLHAIKSVMSDTASIYVHLDWNIGHYVKILMDEVFGEANFINNIVWCYQTRQFSKKHFNRKHHDIFWYAKDVNSHTYNWNVPGVLQDYAAETLKKYKDQDEIGYYRLCGRGIEGSPIKGAKDVDPAWEQTNPELVVRDYLRGGFAPSDYWMIDIVNQASNERTDYNTQKPKALLDRAIKAASDEGMTVVDFFGGSGVTAEVAHDLGRRFIHVDVGVNSMQTARDRLKAAGAAFRVLDIQDGVSLYRNPAQTMDKLKTLITGLKNEDGLDKFWEGAITDSKFGMMPVFLPNLLDHQTKVLDTALVSRILSEAMPDLPDDTRRVVVYYVDIYDRDAVEKYIKEENETGIEIELRDLKEILDEVVLNDEAIFTTREQDGAHVVQITRFTSDRLIQSIEMYNSKKGQSARAKKTLPETDAADDEDAEDGEETDAPRQKQKFKPIQISDAGLELIEWLSLDCTNSEGAWQSDAEIKITKESYMILNGAKTKQFWDATITSARRPLRLKIRNIAGDESVLPLPLP